MIDRQGGVKESFEIHTEYSEKMLALFESFARNMELSFRKESNNRDVTEGEGDNDDADADDVLPEDAEAELPDVDAVQGVPEDHATDA